MAHLIIIESKKMKRYFILVAFVVASPVFAVEKIGCFDVNSQNFFKARETSIVENAIAIAKSHHGTFVRENFDEVRQSLAIARKMIALNSEVLKPENIQNLEEANRFGQIRENYAWPYMTQLKNDENDILVKTLVGTVQSCLMDVPNGPTRRNMRFLKQDDFFVELECGGEDSSNQPGEKAIADYMIQVLDVNDDRMAIFIGSLRDNCLELVGMTNSVVLEGEEVTTSKIYGYISIIENDLNKTAKLLGIIPHFAILHTRGSDNINKLTQAASEEWCAALNLHVSNGASSPVKNEYSSTIQVKEFKEAFVSHIARFYWLHTHACPYHRGSEAVTKWMVKVASGYHGFDLIYPPNFIYRSPFYFSIHAFSILFSAVVALEEIS